MNTVASRPMTADLVARLEADANEIVADWHRSMGLPLPNSVRQRVDLLREAASALRSSGEAVANSECPKCGAPCKRTVHERGGDWGWGTSEEQRATYRYAATPANAWKPIAEAPRDGTRILVHFARDGVGVRDVAWTEPEHADWQTWCVDDLKFGPYALRRWCDGDATHWMPLPTPPTSTKA